MTAAARRSGPADVGRQPSLLDLLSLRDARRFVPETLGLLIVILVVRSLLESSGSGAGGSDPAFWIPVLLMAVHYGIMGGLFAALSASLLLLFTGLPASYAAQDFYDHAASAAVQPCAWFGAALVLGGLRTLHLHNHAQTERRLEDAQAAAALFGERLGTMAGEMELLERRIATDTAGTAVLLDALARIDPASGPALLASLAGFVRHAAGAESYAVFLRQDGRLVPCFAFENGAPVTRAGLAALSPPGQEPARGERVGLASGMAPGLPIRLPILPLGAEDPIGVLICTRVAPALAPGIAASRLKDICRVLAKLLPLVRDDAGRALAGHSAPGDT